MFSEIKKKLHISFRESDICGKSRQQSLKQESCYFYFVIKTDFHSSAYAKNLTYVISLWLFAIYQSAVRQENNKDHLFVQKQLS